MAYSVLLIEDDDNLLELLSETLEDEGLKVKKAASSRSAINLCSKNHFDLIITDIRMAQIDGLSCLKLIKEKQPKVKSIVITGYASLECPQRAMSLQVDDFIYKPFELHTFQTSVRQVLNSAQDRASYCKFLDNCYLACKSMFKGIFDTIHKNRLKVLEKERDRFFNAYFVALRSNAVLIGEALKIWDKLEDLERAYLDLSSSKVDLGKLETAYGYLADYVQIISCRKILTPVGVRDKGKVSRECFSKFFNRIKDSELSLEQLRIAAQLRLLTLSKNPLPEDILDNIFRIWGAVPLCLAEPGNNCQTVSQKRKVKDTSYDVLERLNASVNAVLC